MNQECVVSQPTYGNHTYWLLGSMESMHGGGVILSVKWPELPVTLQRERCAFVGVP